MLEAFIDRICHFYIRFPVSFYLIFGVKRNNYIYSFLNYMYVSGNIKFKKSVELGIKDMKLSMEDVF